MKKTKKGIVVLFMSAALLMTSVLNIWAASENHVTTAPSVVQEKTIFIESNSFVSMRPGNGETDDIRYILSGPELVIELEDELSAGSTIRLKLINAKWFFRDALSTEKFEDGSAILGGASATYVNGAWVADSTDAVGGTYTRPALQADEVPYELTVSPSNDSNATVVFPNGGSSGDTIRIPLVTRTFGFEDFMVEIESSTAISSGRYFFGTAKAETDSSAKSTEEIEKAQENALKAQVNKAIDDGKEVLFELDKNVHAITLSKDVVALVVGADKPINVTNNVVTLHIPLEAIKAAKLDQAEKIEISLFPSQSNVPESMKKRLIGYDSDNATLLSKMYDVAIRADSKPVVAFDSQPTLSFNLKGLTLTAQQKEKLTVVHLNAADSFKQLGGQWQGAEYTAAITSAGRHGVIISNEVVKTPDETVQDPKELIKIHMTIGDTQYTLNGRSMVLDVPPTIMGDYTMVPIRFVAEALKAKVGWDDTVKTATIIKDGQTLYLRLGQKLPDMDVEPVLKDDRLLVPLRYISEHLNCRVNWDEESRTIDISE